jgi:hypothetical protein
MHQKEILVGVVVLSSFSAPAEDSLQGAVGAGYFGIVQAYVHPVEFLEQLKFQMGMGQYLLIPFLGE